MVSLFLRTAVLLLEVIDLQNLEIVAIAEIGKQAGGITFWKMTD